MHSIKLRTEWCKACKICIQICPRQVYVQGKDLNAKGYKVTKVEKLEECTGCKLCELMCPDLVITVEDAEKNG